MNQNCDAIDRKMNRIIIGGAMIGIGILIIVFVWHLSVKERYQQSKIEKEIVIAEQQLIIQERLNIYREEIKNLTKFGSRVVAVETQAVGAAHWLGKLIDEFKYSGGSINSTEILSGNQGSLMTRVRVRLNGKIKVEGLREFLYRIELGERLLNVERLSLSLNDSATFQEQMNIDIVVGSFVRILTLSE